MDFLYGVALLVAGFMLLDFALGAANDRVLRYPFLDDVVALSVTCMIGFGVLFLFFGLAMHPDALHAAELGLSLAVILMSIRGVRRAVLRLFRRNTSQAPASAR